MKKSACVVLALLLATQFSRHSSAALVFYTDSATFQAQLNSLSLSSAEFTNFDLLPAAAVGMNFTDNGIGFSSPGPMRISAGTSSSAPNFLGYDDQAIPDFQAGDTINITLPANARALSLSLITETIPDALSFGTLTVDGQSANTIANGTLLTGNFRSYFLGAIDDANIITSGIVSFTGNGSFYRIDDVGVAAATTVPEPSSLVLVAGFIGLGWVRRRKA